MKNSIFLLCSLLITGLVACVDHALEPTPTGVAAWREGSFLNNFATCMATDKDGNVYLTGRYEDPVTFGSTTLTHSGGDDIFVVKYNSSGEVQWAKRAGTPRGDAGTGIAVDEQGNVYVTGYFSGFIGFDSFTLSASTAPSASVFLSDIFVVKYNSNGDVLWARKAGGNDTDTGQGIAVDGNGNVFITGFFNDVATFGSVTLTSTKESDIYLAKYSTAGDLQWAQKAGGLFSDAGRSVAVDKNGSVFLTGTFHTLATIGGQSLTSKGGTDTFLAKFDQNGALQWLRQAGGAMDDAVGDVAVDDAGNAGMTGSFLGVADIAGTSLTSKGVSDIFVATFDAAGTLKWTSGVGGVNYDQGMRVRFGKNGNVYLAGMFRESVTVGTQTFTTNTASDLLLVKYSPVGAVLWAKQDGGPNSETVSGLALTTMGDVYVAGQFFVSTTLAGISLVSAGNEDIFVVKYKE
jgi:hypothetical protein